NLAVTDEVAGHGNSLIERTAWIVAEVQYERVQPTACLPLERLNCELQCSIQGTNEFGDPHVADAMRLQSLLNRLDVDDLPTQRKDESMVQTGALDGQRYNCVRRPPHLFNSVCE